jgi:hypothetical protein
MVCKESDLETWLVNKEVLPEGCGQEGVATWGAWSGRSCYRRGVIRKELLPEGRGHEGVDTWGGAWKGRSCYMGGMVRKELLPKGCDQE